MSHLGEKVAALVDGQLSPDQAERANIHVALCDDCRGAVEAERRTKQHLAALGPIEPRGDFIHQLMQLAGPSGPLPPRPGHVPGSPRPAYADSPAAQRVPVGVGAPAFAPMEYSAEAAYSAYGAPALGVRERPPARRGSVRPGSAARSSAGRAVGGLQRVAQVSRASRTRVAVAMVGAVCLVGAGVAGGVANSGGGPGAGPRVSPAIATFVGEHVATTTTLPLSDTSLTWGSGGSGR